MYFLLKKSLEFFVILELDRKKIFLSLNLITNSLLIFPS